MPVTVFGIPNCDTVKKARTWLDAQGIAYTFHDYKKQGADPDRIAEWIAAAGRDKVVNRAGTTFRKLSPEDQAALTGDGADGQGMALDRRRQTGGGVSGTGKEAQADMLFKSILKRC